MNIKCLFGFHTWDGCICPVCGKIRDEHHDWSKDCEKCSKCGKTKENQHAWLKDCDECSKCGKKRKNHHVWNGCICSKCSKTRNEQHDWNGCKCSKCGIKRDEQHSWDGCKCLKCGKEQHSFEDYKCIKCGKELNEGTFIDERDKHVYKWIKIGSQIIMAENLAYKPIVGNYWAYENNQSNVKKYGYFYDWKTSCMVALKGWHLPTREEWETLHKFLGADNTKVFNAIKKGGNTGFNALLGGYRRTDGSFNGNGLSSHFWSVNAFGEDKAWSFHSFNMFSRANLDSLDCSLGFSVRLFRD